MANSLATHAPVTSRRLSQWLRAQAGLLFVLPAFALIAVFFLLPLAMALWMSFHDWPIFGAISFVGLGNYAELLSDNRFWRSVLFTIRYTVIITVLMFIFAFPLALLVEKKAPGVTFIRTAFFLPLSIGFATASIIWVLLINPDVGILTALARWFGGEGPVLPLTQANNALITVVVMVLWKSIGFTMVMLLIGLQSIPRDVYEAASIDGASKTRSFFSITLPMMRSSTALALLIVVTSSMQAFDQFFIITHGGPRNQTVTAVYSVYLASFSSYRLGYGAAMSMIILMMLAVFTAGQVFLNRIRRTGYV